jgi:hypothetical protein
MKVIISPISEVAFVVRWWQFDHSNTRGAPVFVYVYHVPQSEDIWEWIALRNIIVV